MCRKSFFISACILLLLTPTFAFAAYDAAYWSNNIGDRDWHNPYNWQCTFDPMAPAYGYCVPDLTIPALIEPVSPGPNIVGDACCAGLYVHPWAWPGASNAQVNIFPAAGFVNCGAQIGICSLSSFNSSTHGHGIINMSGGLVTTTLTNGNLWIGGGGTMTGDCYGILNMSGGLMSVPIIGVYYGIVNLYDGVLEGTSSAPADFIVSSSKAMTRINVAGGTLQLNGDRIIEIEENSRVLPYDGRGKLIADYDTTRTGYTTITAIQDNNIAWNPSPANCEKNVSIAFSLSWSPGDNAGDVNGHRVFFGINFAEVNDANINTPGIYKGTSDVNQYLVVNYIEPNTTYYWRIDEVNDSHPDSPWKGNIWHLTITPCSSNGPTGDFNHDCIVNLYDLKIFTQEWLTAGTVANIYPLPLDTIVDFGDFALMANYWLVTQY